MAYKRKKDGIFPRQSDGRLMLHQRYATAIYWSPQMISDLKRYFPTSTNDECAGILGVSARTIVRKARELRLSKDPAWLKQIHRERLLLAQVASRKAGDPGSFKKGNMIGFEYRFKKKENNATTKS